MAMRAKRTLALVVFGAVLAISGIAVADPQQDFDRNMQNAKEVTARREAEAKAEQMRDKSHDAPRVRTGDDSSVGLGGSPTAPEVNVRKTYP